MALAAIGALGACKDDYALYENTPVAEDGPVTLDFSVTIPDIRSVQTRGLLDEAAGENSETYLGELLPYIFIYEDTGSPESNYLRSLVYGSQVNNSGSSEPDPNPAHSSEGVAVKLKTFSATVDGTAEKAIIHLVLIHEKEREIFEYQLAQMTDRSEIGMFTGATGLLTMSAAYWSRIQLGMPINSANKVKQEFIDKLTHIKMVRNFSQVTVKVKDGSEAVNNFKVVGFVVVNGMDCGYVAAYNEKTTGTGDNFIDFDGKSYDQLTKEINYLPIRHPYAMRNNADNKLEDWLDVGTSNLKNGETWNPDAKYMFERPLQETRMTCILLKGEYKKDSNAQWETGYYKLDIGAYDKNQSHNPNNEEFKGDYIGYGVYEMYHLIRNISYDIEITDAASAGHTSAESAIAGPPANNLTASVQTRNVLTMGDGVDEIGVTVYTGDKYEDKVDGTTVVIVDAEVRDEDGRVVTDANGEPLIVPYPAQALLTWFYKDGEQTPAAYLSNINYSHTGYELKAGGEGVGIIKSIEESNNGKIEWASQGEDWYGCRLHFNTPTDVPQREVVRLYKEFGLSRDVTFVLRKRWEFVTDNSYPSNIEVYPGSYSFDTNTMPAEKLDEVRRLIPGPGAVGSSRGAQLTVMFELPSDIPQELFPLEFKIGFDRQNVENAYTGNAVVVYGESLFSDDEVDAPDVPRMQFVKTVTWDYYNGSGDLGDNGYKIVTARFQTTTDVLDNNAVGEESVTRVRVYNPYFTLGEDDFTREANPTDPDPNQTMWLWYFGDPGWQNYFNANPGHGAGTYNELWFNNYVTGAQFGQYMGMGYVHSENDPEFRFYPDFTVPYDDELAENEQVTNSAQLTINAACLWFDKRVQTGVTWVGTAQNEYIYFRRSVTAIAKIRTKDGGNRSANIITNVTIDKSVPRASILGTPLGDYEGMPQEITGTITLNAGETLEEVIIWSTHYNGDGNSYGTNNEDYAKTLYYTIRLQIQ